MEIWIPKSTKEGIFVGYRYFDSFGEKPLFPFGFGLSYTESKIEFKGIETSEKELTVEMKVTNIGDTYAGKEVVQIYASLPQTEVKKEYSPSRWVCKNKAFCSREKLKR